VTPDLASVGGHPALDFLNSFAKLLHETIELLSGGESYIAWLMLTGQIEAHDAAEIADRFSAQQLDQAAADARALREWLRPVLAAWADDTEDAAGAALPGHVLAHLNDILATDRRYLQLHGSDDGPLAVSTRRRWSDHRQLLIPPAEAAAQLFTTGDRRLIRICEGPACTVWFYDQTKGHRRRWCSMAVCGNRAKVRSHRERDRKTTTSKP
jgi:predicted RNA-binding Zn ribbon-like protein